MGIGLRLPQQFAVLGVQREDVGLPVAEVHGVPGRALASNRSDRERVAHDRSVLERPVDAAGRGVERIDEPVVAPDEHASGRDRRLPVGGDAGRIAERPFQLQPRHLGGGQAGGARGLESGVRQVVAPAVPGGASSGIRQRRVAGAFVRHGLRVTLFRTPQRAAAHELGHDALLRIRQALPLRLHGAGHERVVNLLGRHFTNRRRRGRAFDRRVAVAHRASRLEGGETAFGPGDAASALVAPEAAVQARPAARRAFVPRLASSPYRPSSTR